jgi:hypothetical protein
VKKELAEPLLQALPNNAGVKIYIISVIFFFLAYQKIFLIIHLSINLGDGKT